jgi:PadR family transcriptional regulator PadR
VVRQRRTSRETLAVLSVMLEHLGGELYGLEICVQAGLASGSLYPILAKLERVGWLESRWETADEAGARGTRRRRYYRLTPTGATAAGAELRAARTDLGLRSGDPAIGWLQ